MNLWGAQEDPGQFQVQDKIGQFFVSPDTRENLRVPLTTFRYFHQ